MSQRHQQLHADAGLKFGARNRPVGGHNTDHRIIKVDVIGQRIGVQRHPVFPVFGGVGQNGVAAPVGPYPGLVFYLHAIRAGGFDQHDRVVHRLAQGDAVSVGQHAAAQAVVELFDTVAAAVADVGVTVAAAVVQRRVSGAAAVAIAAAGVAGLYAVAQVVVLQQRAVQAGKAGGPAVQIVGHAVAGAGVPPRRFAVGAHPVAERNIDVKRQHLVAALLPGVSGQAVAQGPVDIVDGGVKPGLELLVGAAGSPVGLVATAQVERGGTPQLLGDAELYPAALVVREVVVISELRLHLHHAVLGLDVVAAHPVIGGVGEAEIAARRVAVAHQLNIGAGIRQRLVIEETHRLPLMLAVIGQGGVGLGDIQRQRPQLPHVFADAEVKGAVAVRQLGTAV